MIKKLEISGIHAKIDKKLRDYVTEKIGLVDKYLPRSARESAHTEVKLIGEKIKTRQVYICEVILYLPHGVITSKENAGSFEEAVDLVEDKLKNQLKKYKDRHGRKRLHHRVFDKIRRR